MGKDDFISAFAFNTGREIEKMVLQEIGSIKAENEEMKGKLLNWYIENGKNEKFAEHFGITSSREGKV